MVNKKELFINGPINYIKLKNNDKIVWIFMDVHMDIRYQEKCEDYEAKDLDKFLFKELNSSTEPIDFFLEINPTDINTEYKYHNNDNYIIQTRKIFSKLYKNRENNKNIRLHYIDIRDYTFSIEIFNLIQDIISNYNINNLTPTINLLQKLNDMLSIQLKFINDIKNKINYEKIDLINLKLKDNLDKEYNKGILQDFGFLQLLDKIFFKYNNDTTKKIINNYFQKNYIDDTNKLIDYINDFIKELNEIDIILYNESDKLNIYDVNLENYKTFKNLTYGFSTYTANNKYSYKIKTKLNAIGDVLYIINDTFMDCFFIRRLIEKKYINKSIVYTGAFHSIVYIWFLVKYFNYNIDDYDYINEKFTIQEIENIIKKSNSYNDLFEYLLPKKFKQCVNLSSSIVENVKL